MALNRALERARQHAVPAWIEMDLPWNEVDRARASQVPRRGAIEVLALAVIQAMCACPAFRSELKGDVLREYSVPVLGVSVALPDDELGMAVICGNDNVESLAAELKKQLELTRQGVKSPLSPQVLLSYVAPLGITAAMPVVVPPAVATLCVGAHGAKLDRTGKRTVKSATMILGFDHRVCNGAGAAQFLKRVVEAIKNLAGDS
jgi:pyruvate/2-oxoglutarate dehydrogenase complex dihydrolipoamide acyltransferase (E2) component